MSRRERGAERPRRSNATLVLAIVLGSATVGGLLCCGAGYFVLQSARRAASISSVLPTIEVSESLRTRGVEFSDWRWNGSHIKGAIRTRTALSAVTVRYAVYDAQGKKLRDSIMNYPSLKAGESADATMWLPDDVIRKAARIVISFGE